MQPDSDLYYVAPAQPLPSRHPPPLTVGPVGWLRKNLFDGWVNSIATLLTVVLVSLFLYEVVRWSVEDADWAVVTANIRFLEVGYYNENELWRTEVVGAIFVFLCGIALGFWARFARALLIALIIFTGIMVILPLIANQLDPAPIRFIVPPSTYQPKLLGPMLFVGDRGDQVTISVEPINRNEYARAKAPHFAGFIEDNRTIQIDATTRNTLVIDTQSRSIWNRIKTEVNRANNPLDLSRYSLLLTVRLLDASGNVLEEVVSAPDHPGVSFRYELPRDAWYMVDVVRHETPSLYAVSDAFRFPQYPVRELPDEGYAWIRLNGVKTFSNQSGKLAERLARYGPMPNPAFIRERCGNQECRRTVAERGVRFEGSRTLSQFFKISLNDFATAIVLPLVGGMVIATIGWVMGDLAKNQASPRRVKNFSRIVVLLWIAYIPFSWILLRGFPGSRSLPRVQTDDWGGLMLTVVLTIIPILVSMPLGILLALGRRSNLPIIGTICTAFIELVRGVPLITLLFMSAILVNFFHPALNNVDDVIKMMVALTLFSAAYQAEIVRGGLQIIPKGQIEAAQALGLNPVLTTVFIILPQALRAVIPAIMSQFVSLFKDTSLVAIIGLFELLGIAKRAVTGSENAIFLFSQREAYLFVGIIYFIISYFMSAVSRQLEETGSGAARR